MKIKKNTSLRDYHNICSSISSDRYRDDCQESVISTTTNTIHMITTTTSSPSKSISKENDLDSNGSSLDTDMDDNTSQSQDSHQYPNPSFATLVPDSVLIVPRTSNDDMHNVSLPEHEDYISNDLSPIHLHSNSITDPILNHHNTTLVNQTMTNDYHHGQVLQYFTDTSNDRLRFLKRSKAIITPSNVPTCDPNGDMNFLYDLITPPAVNRQSIPTQIHHHSNPLFPTDWNGRILFPTSTTINIIDNIKNEHEQQNILR
jgi:hypothetical protein